MTPKPDTTYAVMNGDDQIGIYKDGEYQGFHETELKYGPIPINPDYDLALEGMELICLSTRERFRLEEMKKPK